MFWETSANQEQDQNGREGPNTPYLDLFEFPTTKAGIVLVWHIQALNV